MKKYNVIVVFDKDLNKTLMCKRTKEPYKGMFNLVGGKIERENDGLNEAYRELNEETNITSEDISLIHFMNIEYVVFDKLIEVYYGILNKAVNLIEEVNKLEWVSINDNFFDMNKLNIDVMIQSLGKDGTKSVSFTVTKSDMLRALDLLNESKDYLGIKKLDSDENVAKVSVIGAGIRSHSGVAAKMFGALASIDVNTEMVTTSEIRITALIDEAYADLAVRKLHETFFD